MQTYLVKFAGGIEVEVNADCPAHAQEEAIEYLESVSVVVPEIVSITRITATPL